MKLNIQEIRKQPEGLHFEQALDLAAELRARNQEILDVKDILAVGKVQYEDRLYFLDYQLYFFLSVVLYYCSSFKSQYGAS